MCTQYHSSANKLKRKSKPNENLHPPHETGSPQVENYACRTCGINRLQRSTASDKDMFGRQQNCGCNADEAERLFTRAVACDPFDAYNQANFGIFLRCALCLSGLFFPSECLAASLFCRPPMLPVPCEFSFCPDAQHCPKG